MENVHFRKYMNTLDYVHFKKEYQGMLDAHPDISKKLKIMAMSQV